MPDEILTCTDCRKTYTFSEIERTRFEKLMKEVSGFQMPKRCFECRRERRNEGGRLASSPIPSRAVQKPAPYPFRKVPPAPIHQQKAEAEVPKDSGIRLVLATVDFENLVAGRPVSWQGITVVLADIGYKAMHEAIDRVEQEKFDVRWNR
jgi:hypothetical protein